MREDNLNLDNQTRKTKNLTLGLSGIIEVNIHTYSTYICTHKRGIY